MTLEVLDERRRHLQRLIGTQMTIKRTPRLSFRADPAIAAGSRVEELLRGLHPPAAGARGGPRPGQSRERARDGRVAGPAGRDPETLHERV